jgi:hypothetical protein
MVTWSFLILIIIALFFLEYSLKDLKRISTNDYDKIHGDKVFYSPIAQAHVFGYFISFSYVKIWTASNRKWLYLSVSFYYWSFLLLLVFIGIGRW